MEKNKEEKAVVREGDIAVRLIKLLHQRNGVSKEEIAKELGVSTRIVQKYLRKLDPDMYIDKNYPVPIEPIEPFRIGGQQLSAKISVRREGRKEYYFTENSIHPIVLQENLTQIYCLINSLALYYEDNNLYRGFEFDTACDIWCQLSEYAKDKTKNYFKWIRRDEGVLKFITVLEEKTGNNYAPHYRKEETDKNQIRALLEVCYKIRDIRCDIVVGSKKTEYKNIRIHNLEYDKFSFWDDKQIPEYHRDLRINDIISIKLLDK